MFSPEFKQAFHQALQNARTRTWDADGYIDSEDEVSVQRATAELTAYCINAQALLAATIVCGFSKPDAQG